MNTLLLYSCALLTTTVAQETYTITDAQQTKEYWKEDCDGKRRMGLRLHDIFFEKNQQRKLNYPVFCCSDYYLLFSNSSIPTLATYSFGTRPSYILSVMMNETNISEILPDTFRALDHLICLDLSNNDLKMVQNETFDGLKRLQVLNLANNRIKKISGDAFKNIPLREVFLQNNLISILDDNLFFSQRKSLSLIDLSRNRLKNINNTFVGVSFFDTLNLSHNLIEIIDISSIKCRKIYLRNNSISQTGAIALGTTILDLSENQMKSIENLGSTLINSSILRLDLGHNEIQLNDNSLLGLHDLTFLQLNNNKFGKISNSVFRELKSLIFLDISHNNISQFVYGTFDYLSNLQFLNMSHNEFTNVQLHVLSPMQKLTELDIRNNRIEELDIESFLYHCSGVQKVKLDGNFWTCRSLTHIVTYCHTKNVNVVRGNLADIENVRGIPCYNDDFLITNGAENKNSNQKFNLNSPVKRQFFNSYEHLRDHHSNLNRTPINDSSISTMFGISLFFLILIFFMILTIFILLLKKFPDNFKEDTPSQDNVELI